MVTESTPPQPPPRPPVPVAPLDYFDRQAETTLPLVRTVLWLVLLYDGIRCLAWVTQVVCFWCEPRWRFGSRWIRADLIWIDLLLALTCGVAAAAAAGCLRFSAPARSALVVALVALAIVGPLTNLAEAVPYMARMDPVRDPVGTIAYLSRYLFAAAQSAIIPVLLFRMLNRPETRSLFR